MSETTVEVLSWSGCPSHHDAVAQLRRVLDAMGRTEVEIITRWVETEIAARRQRFAGSPSYRIDGHELIAVAEDAVFGLGCRVYRKRDGRASPLPDDQDLREALSARLPD